MVKTVERIAAETRTVHYGTSMIVLNKGRRVTVDEADVPFLERDKLITDTKLEGLDGDGDGKAGGSLPRQDGQVVGTTEPVVQPVAEALESAGPTGGSPVTITVGDKDLPVPSGYEVEPNAGGWYTITGPEGFEPVKAHGAAKLEEALTGLPAIPVADGVTDDGAPAA